MDNRYDLTERFAAMFRRSREIGGKSQEYMAKALGVSKKTVQNWEQGLSCPSQITGLHWFKVLDLQPMPFYLNLIYPEVFTDLRRSEDDKRIEDAIALIVQGLPIESKKKLLYLLCGDHGSSVIGMIELINTHLQTPLRDRVSVAQSAATNYEIALACGKVRQPEHIQPNMELLYRSIGNGKQAVIDGHETYSNVI